MSELICSQDDDPGTSKSGDTCSNLCIDRRSVTLNMSKRSLLTAGQISVSSSLTERLTILSRRIAVAVASRDRHIEYSFN